MVEFNFKSQICTTREQSKRLIALGLKKETADMGWVELNNGEYAMGISKGAYSLDIPAWSLHRLWELNGINRIELYSIDEIAILYDEVINNTEWLIKEGYFNKEYLEE